jgi:hypothetical protein
MAISSTDRRAKNVQILLKKTQSKLVLKNGHNQVIFLELWQGPKTTTWIWNLRGCS